MTKRCLLSCLFLVPIAVATQAHGAEIFSFANVYPGDFSPDGIAIDGGSGVAMSSVSLVSNFGSSTFSGDASASTSYLEFSGRASASLTNFAPRSYYSPCSFDPTVACGHFAAIAEAGFTDTLTITGGTGGAFLGLGFDITGTTSLSSTLSPPNAEAIATIIGTAGQSFDPAVFFQTFVGDDSFIGTIPFVFGVPLTFSVFMEFYADAWDIDAATSYDFTGLADFSTTARLTSFRVYSDEELQNEVTGIVAIAESGTDYRSVNSAPEPSTTLLLLGALALLRRSRASVCRYKAQS